MAVKPKARIATTFYTKRSLEVPATEYWPESFDELQEILASDLTRVVVIGGGQSTPPVTAESNVIRTDKLDTFLLHDRESAMVRVMSGMTWRGFKESIRERGLTTNRYRLYPDLASLGGILSTSSIAPTLWGGDLQTHCIGMSVVTPNGGYRYLSTPRKSSGPDLRSLYIGSGGAFGVIADLSLNVFPEQPTRCATWACDWETARKTLRGIWLDGWLPSWCHYQPKSETLTVTLHGPDRVAENFEKFADGRGADVTDVADRDAIESKLKYRRVERIPFDISIDPAEIVGSSLHGVLVARSEVEQRKPSHYFKQLKSNLDADAMFAIGGRDT